MMHDAPLQRNAVLGDEELQSALKSLNERWGSLCIQTAGKVWGMPLIDQKTKAFMAIATDIVTGNVGEGSPYEVHVHMALKQGATIDEIEEVLMFLSVYAGFNRVASALWILAKLRSR